MEIKEIQKALKLIPNNFEVCLEDLEEIFLTTEENGIIKTEKYGRKREI